MAAPRTARSWPCAPGCPGVSPSLPGSGRPRPLVAVGARFSPPPSVPGWRADVVRPRSWSRASPTASGSAGAIVLAVVQPPSHPPITGLWLRRPTSPSRSSWRGGPGRRPPPSRRRRPPGRPRRSPGVGPPLGRPSLGVVRRGRRGTPRDRDRRPRPAPVGPSTTVNPRRGRGRARRTRLRTNPAHADHAGASAPPPEPRPWAEDGRPDAAARMPPARWPTPRGPRHP